MVQELSSCVSSLANPVIPTVILMFHPSHVLTYINMVNKYKNAIKALHDVGKTVPVQLLTRLVSSLKQLSQLFQLLSNSLSVETFCP